MAEIEPEAELVDVEPPEHALAERLGAVLRQRRVAMGMRQDELALAAGVGRRFIIDLEAGKASCQLGKAMLVAEALGLRIVDFFDARIGGESDETGNYYEPNPPQRVRPTKRVDVLPDLPDLPDDLEEPLP